ncbi:MAG: RNA-guided endonuclease TnpB family protein, partial [Mycobacteriales bacterium]
LLEVRRLRAAEHAAGVEGAKPDTKYPSFFDLNTAFNGWKRGATAPSWWMATHPDTAPEWVGENASQVYLWAIYEARDALNRYFDSYKAPGARRVGFPHRKSRRRDRPRFKVTGGTTAARPVDSRHIRLPVIGAVRTHESTCKLLRRFTDGRAVIKNATVSRVGTRWFVAFSCEVQRQVRTGPSRRQRAGGVVGVDVGVKALAALSTGEIVPNPKIAARYRDRKLRTQRAIARCQKDSRHQADLYRRLRRLQAAEASARRDSLHQLTSRIVHAHDAISVEDLNVAGMTASARGTLEKPGRNVRAKAGLNRGILDAAFGELRRQLEYKTTWYGSRLHIVDRWAPTSKTCSACLRRHPNLTLADRTFHCTGCGLVIDRDLNAALNLRRLAADGALLTEETQAAVAPTAEETLTAHRADISLPSHELGSSRRRRAKPAPTRQGGARRAARPRKRPASTRASN